MLIEKKIRNLNVPGGIRHPADAGCDIHIPGLRLAEPRGHDHPPRHPSRGCGMGFIIIPRLPHDIWSIHNPLQDTYREVRRMYSVLYDEVFGSLYIRTAKGYPILTL